MVATLFSITSEDTTIGSLLARFCYILNYFYWPMPIEKVSLALTFLDLVDFYRGDRDRAWRFLRGIPICLSIMNTLGPRVCANIFAWTNGDATGPSTVELVIVVPALGFALAYMADTRSWTKTIHILRGFVYGSSAVSLIISAIRLIAACVWCVLSWIFDGLGSCLASVARSMGLGSPVEVFTAELESLVAQELLPEAATAHESNGHAAALAKGFPPNAVGGANFLVDDSTGARTPLSNDFVPDSNLTNSSLDGSINMWPPNASANAGATPLLGGDFDPVKTTIVWGIVLAIATLCLAQIVYALFERPLTTRRRRMTPRQELARLQRLSRTDSARRRKRKGRPQTRMRAKGFHKRFSSAGWHRNKYKLE